MSFHSILAFLFRFSQKLQSGINLQTVQTEYHDFQLSSAFLLSLQCMISPGLRLTLLPFPASGSSPEQYPRSLLQALPVSDCPNCFQSTIHSFRLLRSRHDPLQKSLQGLFPQSGSLPAVFLRALIHLFLHIQPDDDVLSPICHEEAQHKSAQLHFPKICFQCFLQIRLPQSCPDRFQYRRTEFQNPYKKGQSQKETAA